MTDSSRSSRRSFLKRAAAALGITTATAGCVSDEQLDDLVTPTPTNSPIPTPLPSPTPSPTPEPTPTPDLIRENMTPFDASENDRFPEVEPVEKTIHEDINETRKDHDLDPLVWRIDLAYVARDHSRDMAQRDFFAHRNPDGELIQDRIERFNVEAFPALAENIFKVDRIGELSRQEILGAPIHAWMNSPDHRESILDETWTHAGVGVYFEKDTMFATQVMGAT